MKGFLIAANLILALLAAHAAWDLLRAAPPAMTAKTSGTRTEKTAKAAAEKHSGTISLKATPEAGRVVAGRNVFDQARCPGAMGGRGRSGGGVNSMSLVGIYRVGPRQGAVILFKNTGNRNVTNVGTLRINNRTVPALGAASAPANSTSTQCYFRKGDLLPNGYTLSRIDAASITLSRGANQLVLPLALASENAPRSSGRRSNANPMLQMVQLMQQSVNMQQMQQMNMMRMMRNQQSNSGSGSNRNAPARSTRSR